MKLLNVINFVFLMFVSSSSFAQVIEMNNSPLRDFVTWYSKQTGESVIVSPDVKGTVTVYSSDVKPDNLRNFFISVLRANNYDMVGSNPSIIQKYNPNNQDYIDELPASDSQEYDDNTPPSGGFFVPQNDNVTETFKINNVRAKDLIRVVELFVKSNTSKSSNVLSVDGSNLLVVSAPKDILSSLPQFLSTVDLPTDQILIEGLIFEVQQGEALDFSFAAGSQRGTVAGGVNTDRLTSVLSSAGGSFGIFNGDVLGLSVRALKTNSHSKILSVPRILTLSGQKGSISVGQNVPFITGRVTGESANVNNPFQTIERQNVGISMSVFPVAMAGGNIVLDITSKADSLSSSTQASDVITNQRSIATTVNLRDGQTLLLGGLTNYKNASQDSGVPFLSKIPLIGLLFSSRSDSDEESTLYVLVKATVVRAL